MCHMRAFSLVHALCSDVVVSVSALWSCPLFWLLPAMFPVFLLLAVVIVLFGSSFGNRLPEVT